MNWSLFLFKLKAFFRNPRKYLRDRKNERILNEGSANLDTKLEARLALRQQVQEWLLKKRQSGVVKSDHHARQLLEREFGTDLRDEGVRALVRGNQVEFRKVRNTLRVA